jgi:hypothetical protein
MANLYHPPQSKEEAMRTVHVVAGATLVTAALPAFGAVSPAHVSADPVAVDGSYALNGTYTAVSDGQWARKNESFRNDEATVTSTWIFTSTCPNPYACTGTVTSDQGWSAPAHSTAGMWYVSRDLPNWEPCAYGGAAPGHQVYRFYTLDASTLLGADKTIGASGGCGQNLPLVIEMPFKLTKKQ